MSVLLLGYGLLLARNLGSWRTAGVMSQSILEALESHSGAERIEILNLPDNISGAYVFRNGLNSAEALFLGRDRSSLLGTYEIYDAGTAVVRAPTATGVSLVAVGPGTSFRHPVESLPGCARLQAIDAERRRLDIDLTQCREEVPVLYHDGEALVAIR